MILRDIGVSPLLVGFFLFAWIRAISVKGLFFFCAYVTILLKKNVAIKIDNRFFIIIHFFDY